MIQSHVLHTCLAETESVSGAAVDADLEILVEAYLTTDLVSRWGTGLRWNIANNYLTLTFEVCCTSN